MIIYYKCNTFRCWQQNIRDDGEVDGARIILYALCKRNQIIDIVVNIIFIIKLAHNARKRHYRKF